MPTFRGSVARRVFLLSLAALTLGLPVTLSLASVVWTGDFETGTLAQWSFKFKEGQMKAVTTPVRAGKYALEVSAVANGDRVEVQHGSSNAGEGMERYYAWSVMTPRALGPNDHQTGYFESKNSFQQIMAFVIKGTDVSLDVRTPNSRRVWNGRGRFTLGVWHDFIAHIKWSQNNANGFIELWFDGQKVLNQTTTQTLWDGNAAFFEIGFLNGQAGEVVYVDEAREGTTLSDVQLAPLAVPDAGAGTGGAAAGGAGGRATGGMGSGGSSQGGAAATGGSGGGVSGGAGGGSDPAGQGGETGAGGDAAEGGGGGDDPDPASGKRSSGCTINPRAPAGSAAILCLCVALIGCCQISRAKRPRAR